jgi:prepilin-type N-terminal cleavage/methylation domain-containing protein
MLAEYKKLLLLPKMEGLSLINMKKDKGFGLIEIIISIALVTIFLLTFTTLTLEAIKISQTNTKELKATMCLQELIEIAKDLEQSNWEEITNSNCYDPNVCHPEIQDNKWILVPGEENLDGYQRSLSIEPVYRDQLSFPNIIVSNNGVLDPDTKKIVTKISWDDGFNPRSLILETYVYNFQP